MEQSDARATIAALSEELLDRFLTDSPVEASLMGIPGYDDRLPDLSEAAERTTEQHLRDLRSKLVAVDTDDPAVVLERDVVTSFVDGALERLSAATLEIAATDYFSAPLSGLLAFLPQVVLRDEVAAADYLTRLRALPAFSQGAADRLLAGTRSGRVAVAHLARRSVEQLDRYLADPAHDPFGTVSAPEGWDGAAAWRTELDQVLADVVRPAIAAYRDVVQREVLPTARPTDKPGLLWLPGGDEAYAALVRYHTTVDRDPREIHQVGLDAIARLREEYAEIGGRALGVSEPAEVFRRLRQDPALRWSSSEEILRAAEAVIRRAEEAAPAWFGRLPAQRCRVEPVPAVQEASAPAAYYFAPALDGSRPGTYYANTFQPEQRFRFESEAIAFHEAVPGHHFQLTLMQEVDLSRLRQIYTVTAYAEGWGLYAERLADEMGLYSDDLARLGMLSADSMRAARLVLDTGLHAMGWSREQAVAYSTENTPMAAQDIEVEVDRYISDPGQALAYMTGRLEIQRVRALAEQRLGDAFDIRGFHDAVLGVGGVPLGLLERVVGQWCASVAGQDS